MLETENLRLRRPEIHDLDAIHAMRSDPDVVRHLGGRTLGREEAWHRLTRIVGHWVLRGYGMFVAVEKASGSVIGEVGLFDGCRGL
ncbi:GNAT family N-acetyltransferase, partial [Bosea sp. CER48]|uniref:GNAT family N-acetyltransferase n=1 Tax=Bosea sp. CER48 TaxID=3377035 RepID=UPI003803C4A0